MSKNPLAYLGISRTKTPEITLLDSAPTTSYFSGFNLGDVVIDKTARRAYMLVSVANSIATWEPISSTGFDYQESVLKQCAVGAATATEGNRYLCNSTGGGWTSTYIYEYSSGEWVGTAPSDGMIVYDEETATILIYSGAAWGNLSVTIAAATETTSGVIELATTAEATAGTDTTRAVTAAGLAAKLGAQTDHGVLLGSGSTAAVTATATGTAGQPLLSGGSGADPDWGTLGVAYGGTGATTLTDHSVLIGSGTSAVTALTVGTDGQVLVGSSAADPVFHTLTSSDSTITFTTGAGTLSIQAAAASTTQPGVVERATNAEIIAGTDDTRYITPKGFADNLSVTADATESSKGITEIATQAEITTGTDDFRYITPLKFVTALASPPAIGGTLAAAGTFAALTSGGATSLQGGQLDLATDNAANAVNIGLGTTARAIAIGSSAAGHTLTLGSNTGACSIDMVVGTGNFTLNGVAGSTYTIGASTTTGTITIGGTSQTGTMTFGSSDGTSIVAIAAGTGASTVNIANGTGGNTVSIGNGANGAAQTINISAGASAANSTVNILTGNGTAGTQTCNVLTGTRAGALNLGTGAAAHVVTLGSTNTTSSTTVQSGTGDLALTSADAILLDATGVLELNSSGGVIGIGNDDIDQAINIGTQGERVITIGNVVGACGVAINVSGGNFALEGDVASTYAISNTGANTGQVDIAGGTGARTINLGGGGTGAKTINIGAAASADLITIGTADGAGSLALACGTGNFTLEGATATSYAISNTGVNTGQVDIAGGTGARTINIGGGGTGAKTINIGAAASADVITIGTADGAGSMALACGTGNFTLEGATATSYAISNTGVNTGQVDIAGGTGARTINIGGGGTGAKTINIGAAASADVITIGTADGAGSLSLNCGTGNFALEGATASTYDISATGANTGTCRFGCGTGARQVDLGTGGTGVKTINIGTGATADVITIGTADGAGSLALVAGTGNFTLEGATATTYDISATGANTGTCRFGCGTGARQVDLATGGTGIKTINIGTGATADVITIGDTTGAGSLGLLAGTGGTTFTGKHIYVEDAITATDAGVAASLTTVVTEITTNGDADLDMVTLGDGVDGQLKIFAIVASGNPGDSVKITPTNLVGGTQITFAADPEGLGCIMYFDSGVGGWIIVANNGGVLA